MHMWFWFGNNLGNFLLPGYNVATPSSFFCTCLGLFALAILYESMKVLQIKLHQSTLTLIQSQSPTLSENSCLLPRISSKSIRRYISLHCAQWSTWSFQIFHWFVHTSLGYLLMLAVMSYNIYVNIAIILGGGIGYWIFGSKLIELNMKQFFKKQTLINCDKECADNTTSYQGDGLTVTEQLVTETNVEIHISRDTC
ncbi:High affinity copper uptake protein 1 [Melipona quadrifasciata]|uniref:Copper transport protein n=1 Tax=Melipona quadrifasciata TaxID=166423 RepID=A0A0N0BJM8_9HYME|nr:High affinity copper uptake protein 1 [Melipona quadrifasciata]